jgi:transcriptional regulator GlxA family with amidase domain
MTILAAMATVPAVAQESAAQPEPKTLGVVLYPGFEVLDVFGPVEMFMNLGPQQITIVMIAQEAGPVSSGTTQEMGQTTYSGPKVVADYGFADAPDVDILLVPGGIGTLPELQNPAMLEFIRERAPKTELTTSVCSGSALLAKAGVLDGKRATCNKAFFQMLTMNGPDTDWAENARWVEDGNIITSSGVSAGIDMALAVIARVWGEDVAEGIAEGTEYVWSRDPHNDPFAITKTD